jgi:hypothetical protein
MEPVRPPIDGAGALTAPMISLVDPSGRYFIKTPPLAKKFFS